MPHPLNQICKLTTTRLEHYRVWYRATTPDVIERIIQEHLIGNRIVQDYAFLTHPLPTPANADSDRAHQLYSVPNLEADSTKVEQTKPIKNHQETIC